MKAFSIMFIFLLAAGGTAKADSCLNFSGSYQNLSNSSEILVQQVDCVRIEITYIENQESQDFALDGVKHKMLETPKATWWATAYYNQKWDSIVIENETLFSNGKKILSTRKLSLDYTFSPGNVYLLDQRGKIQPDGVFVPNESQGYLKK